MLCQAQRKPIRLPSSRLYAPRGPSPNKARQSTSIQSKVIRCSPKREAGRAAALQSGSPPLPSPNGACVCVCARVHTHVCARSLTPFRLPHPHCTNSVLWGQGQARPCCWFWESLGRRDLISQYEQQTLRLSPGEADTNSLLTAFSPSGMRLVSLCALPGTQEKTRPSGTSKHPSTAASARWGPRPVAMRRGCPFQTWAVKHSKEPNLCWLDQDSPARQGWEGREKSSLKESGRRNKSTSVWKAEAGDGQIDELIATKYCCHWARGTREFITLFSLHFFSLLGHACSMWKFRGQGSNPYHSSNLSHHCDNTGSLTR